MKLIISLLIIIHTGLASSQNHEVNFEYRIGISNRNTRTIDLNVDINNEYRNIMTNYDQGFLFNYKYRFWKKHNWFISAGVEFSKSTHYKQMVDYRSYYHLENIIINKRRTVLHFGVNKQFIFYDGSLVLDIGASLTKRFYNSEHDIYKSDFKRSDIQPWIEYKYELNAFYNGDYNASGIPIGYVDNKEWYGELSFNVKYKLFNNLFLNTGFSYTRNNVFFYDYTYTINYYMNGSTTPTDTYSFLGLFGSNPEFKYGIREHFIYFNLGLSYKFNFKK